MKQLFIRKYAVAAAGRLKSNPTISRLYENLRHDAISRDTFVNLREHDRMLADSARLEPGLTRKKTRSPPCRIRP